MPSHSIRKSYCGYQIIATGEACEIVLGKARIDDFAREYVRLGVPAELALALLMDEAEERIDAIFRATECLWPLTLGHPWTDRSFAR